jgi:hypothetical protein
MEAARTLMTAVGEPVAARWLASPGEAACVAPVSDADWAAWQPQLAGTVAAELQAATAMAQQRQLLATGKAARLQELSPVWRQSPALTGAALSWRAHAELLSQRPWTLVDPRAVERQRWRLNQPE